MILLCFVFVSFVFNVFYAATYLTRAFLDLSYYFSLLYLLLLWLQHIVMLDQITSTYSAVEVLLYLPWYDILCSIS